MKERERLGRPVVSIISYFSNRNGFMLKMRKHCSDRAVDLYPSNVIS